MKLLLIITLALLQSCSSTSDSKVKFIEKPSDNCEEVASLSSFGFNIIPPIATMLAKKGLKMKAEEFGVNSIMINETKGTFEVHMNASGYNCF